MPRRLPQPNAESFDLTQVLSALGDPVRLEILRLVAQSEEPVECSSITLEVAVAPSTVSHHFKVLREAGLTTTVVDGRRRQVALRMADVNGRFPGLLAAVLGAVG